MPRPIYQRVAVTDTGDIIPGAEYTVTNENTGTEQTIYNARSGGSVITQPAFADANGVIQFWTDPGVTYRVEATGGVGTYTDRYVEANSAQTSPTDTTPDALMKVGAGGWLIPQTIVASGSFNDLIKPAKYWVTASSVTDGPDSSNAFIVDVSGGDSGANKRYTQTARLISSTGVIAIYERTFRTESGWAVWQELYHTGNLNTLEFFGAAGRDIAYGFAESGTVAAFSIPINLFSVPSSITVTGTFAIIDAGGATLASGVTPVITGRSSVNLLTLQIVGLTGLATGEPLRLRCTDSSSKITVNP